MARSRAKLETVLAIVLILLVLSTASGETTAGRMPTAVDAVLAAIERHRIVALGEIHGSIPQHAFIQSLIDDPRLGDVCDDIVVEFANSRYQDRIDRFIRGDEVSIEQIAPAWRNTAVSPFQQWQAPMYRELFEAVRRANLRSASGNGIRIVAAGVPIDWESVRTPEDHEPFLARSTHFAAVVEREVLGRGRRGLLIAGSAHVVERSDSRGAAERDPAAGKTLSAKYGDAYFSIIPVFAATEWPEGLAEEFDRFEAPTVIPIASSPLHRRDAGLVFRDIRKLGPDGPYNPFHGVPMSDVADALLWLGLSGDSTFAGDDPVGDDRGYYEELRRRAKIFGADWAALGIAPPDER